MIFLIFILPWSISNHDSQQYFQISCKVDYCPIKGNPSQFWIHIPGTGFQYLSVELGFWPWIPIVGGIPDSLSCIFLDSNTQDSGFHKQNILELQIPEAKISRIPLRGVIN